MTQPRKRLISIDDTPYYHCIGRCVRRAFLCGTDEFSGHNYEHRRQWVTDRLKTLTRLFAIHVCSYAVMSNHYHLVLKLNPTLANDWSDQQVVERWSTLFSGNQHTRAYLNADKLSDTSQAYLTNHIPQWRERLANISWFMRCLNEHIARKANQEDNCTGRFWEGRFKSQALLDESALVSCMAYVDLNPIRAGIAKTPETSEHTSIQARIHDLIHTKDKPSANWLVPMNGQSNHIPIDLDNYLALVDWTGRAQLTNKPGAIPNHLYPIINRLGLSANDWLATQQGFGKHYRLAFGAKARIKTLANRIGQHWLSGQGKTHQFGYG